MSNFDRTRALELVAQAREDDSAMTPSPWEEYSSPCCPDMGGITSDDREPVKACLSRYGHPMALRDAEGIARTRNNLRALADQLEAAVAAHDRAWADDVRLAAKFSAGRDAGRDAARAEVERLRARLAVLEHLAAPYIPASASVWYMHDNHTFTRLHGSIDDVLAEAKRIGAKSPHGMLGAVHLLNADGKEVRRAGESIHAGPNGLNDDDLATWRASVMADADAARLLSAKRDAHYLRTDVQLMDIVNAAAERFDNRPEYRASIEARAELHTQISTLASHVGIVEMMAEELRARRAADLTPGEVEALRFARLAVADDRDRTDRTDVDRKQWGEKWELALAVLDRLIAQHNGGAK